MGALLNLAFENPRSLWFIEIGNLEQLSRVEPTIVLPPHHKLLAHDQFIHGSAQSQSIKRHTLFHQLQLLFDLPSLDLHSTRRQIGVELADDE